MAQSLLLLALMLLLQAQQPGVPDSLKLEAISTANKAIIAAKAELAVKPLSEIPVGIGAPTAVCVEKPELTLAFDSSTELTGTYSTGCNLDPNTKWSFDSNDPSHSFSDKGTINQFYDSYTTWRLDGPTPGKEVYTKATYHGFYRGSATQFTLTVGSTSQTVSI